MAHLYYNFWRKYSILPLAYRALLAIHSPASNHNACVIPTVRQVSTSYMKPHTCCSQIALQRTEIASFRYLLATYRVWCGLSARQTTAPAMCWLAIHQCYTIIITTIAPIPSTKLWSSSLINMLPFITCCYRSVHRVKLLSARIVSKNLPWLLIDFVCLHVDRWWMGDKERRRCPSIFMTEYVQYVALVDMNVRVHRDRDWWFVSNEVTDGFDLALFLHR